jgi:tetratricopeptide (TPR) repeat protein
MHPSNTRPGRGSAVPRLLAVLGLLASCALASCSGSEDEAPAAKVSSPERAGDPKPAREGGTSPSAKLAYQTALNWLVKSDPEKARAEFERAIELDPKMADAHFELGKLLVLKSSANVGSTTRDRDILDAGIAALARASELVPENDDYAYWLGRAYDIGNQKDKALEHLRRAVELNPENGAAHKRLGMVHMEDSALEVARDCFQKAIECEPDDAGAHYQLGQVLELLADEPGARAAYERAIELDRSKPEPYLQLSKILAKQGDEEGAARNEEEFKRWSKFDRDLDALSMAVGQNPQNAAALVKLGEQFFAVQKWPEALEWFQRAIHLEPRNVQAHFYCGIIQRKLGNHAAATNHLKEAEFLEPDSLDPKLELVRLYAETKDEAALVDVLAQIEEEAQRDALAMLALGLVCDEIGRPADAKRFLEHALAADPQDVTAQLALKAAADGRDSSALLALAAELEKSGQHDAARVRYQRVLELDPANAVARAALEAGYGGDAR